MGKLFDSCCGNPPQCGSTACDQYIVQEELERQEKLERQEMAKRQEAS